MPTYRLEDLGDTALAVVFDRETDEAAAGLVAGLYGSLAARPDRPMPSGLIDLVPGMRSLLFCYDPDRLARTGLADLVAGTLGEQAGDSPQPRQWRIPVCYDPEFGLDLAELAENAKIGVPDLIARHVQALYRVRMLGFMPGFAYLSGLPKALERPRRATPRPRLAAGSVAVAGAMSAIYPADSPGGWHILGRTPVRLFDQLRDPPALFAPGDFIRFEAIDRTRFEALAERPTDPLCDRVVP